MLSSLSRTIPSSDGASGDSVREVNLSNFVAEVIEASKQQPVIVDFWATWCGPCKQLGPVLEKLVREHKGAVRLAKIDIDKNPQIAQQMGVQSIPAVFAFFRGQPIDGFMGALPEGQVRTWLNQLVKVAAGADSANGVDDMLKQAEALLTAGESSAAGTVYQDILELDPTNAPAYAGTLKCLIGAGETDRAKNLLQQAPAEMTKDKAFDAIRTALELAEQVRGVENLAELQRRLDENSSDHQARFDLAMAYYAVGQREQAIEQLLELVRRSRTWNDDAGRKQLVKFFEVFGPSDPLTLSARKRLSSILFS